MNKINLLDNYIPNYNFFHHNRGKNLLNSNKSKSNSLKSYIKFVKYSNKNVLSNASSMMVNSRKLNSVSSINKLDYKTSFKELIPQFFRNKDIVILNKFNNNIYVKKQLINKLLNVVGVPISLGDSSRYTFDRILSNSNLVIKTNDFYSPKFLFYNTIKNNFLIKGIDSIDEYSIQRTNLLKNTNIRRKLNSSSYFNNAIKHNIKKSEIKKLFKVMSNQTKNGSKNILNSRINGNFNTFLFLKQLPFNRYLSKYIR